MTPLGITILKGLAIGICASAPLGPVGILVLQKSIVHGQKTGFVTGLGAAFTDTIYSIIAVFFLAITQEFLDAHENIILLFGGVIVAALGVGMALKNPFRKLNPESPESAGQPFSMSGFFQSIVICISNPGAIALIFSLFQVFSIDINPTNPQIVPILLSVSGGCVLWWLGFSALFGIFRKRIKVQAVIWINRVFGILLIIAGLGLFAGALFKYVI